MSSFLDAFLSMCAALLRLCAIAFRLCSKYEVTHHFLLMRFLVCVLPSWDCALLSEIVRLWGDHQVTHQFSDKFMIMCAGLLRLCTALLRVWGAHETATSLAAKHLFWMRLSVVCAPTLRLCAPFSRHGPHSLHMRLHMTRCAPLSTHVFTHASTHVIHSLVVCSTLYAWLHTRLCTCVYTWLDVLHSLHMPLHMPLHVTYTRLHVLQFLDVCSAPEIVRWSSVIWRKEPVRVKRERACASARTYSCAPLPYFVR